MSMLKPIQFYTHHSESIMNKKFIFSYSAVWLASLRQLPRGARPERRDVVSSQRTERDNVD